MTTKGALNKIALAEGIARARTPHLTMRILYARHIFKIILCLAREQMQECWATIR